MHPKTVIFILCALLFALPWHLHAMAQIVAPELVMVPLKNGTFAPAKLAFNTHLAVTQIIASHNCFAVRELLENCLSDSDKPVSEQSGRILFAYGLVTAEHRPKPLLINILKSMARGKGDKLAVINPVLLKEPHD